MSYTPVDGYSADFDLSTYSVVDGYSADFELGTPSSGTTVKIKLSGIVVSKTLKVKIGGTVQEANGINVGAA